VAALEGHEARKLPGAEGVSPGTLAPVRALALPLTLAALIAAGCGGGDDSHSIQVSLSGGEGNRNATACGKQEPFQRYTTRDEVRYSGRVDPAPDGRWKVKVKIKKCSGNEFVESGSQKIVGLPGGRYEGSFVDIAQGYYFHRARYQGGDQPETDKFYFEVK
jgi:hypothetical protein